MHACYILDWNSARFLQRWKHGLKHVPNVLQELRIFTFALRQDLTCLITLMDTFAGQPLKKFLFIHLDNEPTVKDFMPIAKSFPQLRELTLTNSVRLEPWCGDVVRFAFSTSG